MAKKEGLSTLKKMFLADCSPEVAFWVRNGTVVRNIAECAKAIDGLDDETFAFHVNKGKNDFATWINDIFQDTALANKLKKVKTRKTYASIIRQRVEELQAA